LLTKFTELWLRFRVCFNNEPFCYFFSKIGDYSPLQEGLPYSPNVGLKFSHNVGLKLSPNVGLILSFTEAKYFSKVGLNSPNEGDHKISQLRGSIPPINGLTNSPT
jgi:hypothetical protein